MAKKRKITNRKIRVRKRKIKSVEPDIFAPYEDYIVDEKVPDIRAKTKRPYSSGVEAFSCDLIECKKEQDFIRGIAGLKTNEDRVLSILKGRANSYFRDLESIRELEKSAKEKKADIEALLLALNAENIHWNENRNFLSVVMNGQYLILSREEK